jgi:hypothetical protein
MPSGYDFGRRHARGRRLLPAAVLFVVTACLAQGAAAQRVPGGSGTGGGAGYKPTPPLPTMPAMPQMTPTMPGVAAPPPAGAPQAAPPVAVPAAPVVRPRCQLAPGAAACKAEPAPDGGGGDEECNCARDYCYDDPAGSRICQKQ